MNYEDMRRKALANVKRPLRGVITDRDLVQLRARNAARIEALRVPLGTGANRNWDEGSSIPASSSVAIPLDAFGPLYSEEPEDPQL